MWWILSLAIGLGAGLLGGYFLGVWCAQISEADLQRRNAELYWTLRGLMEAAEPLHDDARLGAMLKTAWDVIKGDQ